MMPTETSVRRSSLFKLRGAMCFVVLSLLVFHPQQVSPLLWYIGTAYLVSNLIVRIAPATLFANPNVAYGVLFLDLAGLTVVLYSIAGLGSESWLLFYLIVFMATLGESVARSVGIAFGASALYVWFNISQGHEILNDSDALLRLPLFLVTGVLCGYLAQEVRRHKQRIRDMEEVQEALKLQVGSYSQKLERTEQSRSVAQELAARFRDLVQDLNAVVWEMDVPTLRVTFVSNQAEPLLGYPVDRWLSDLNFWTNHIHPEDRRRVVELCRKAALEGNDHNLEYRALTADGRVIWLQDVVRVIRDGNGKVYRLRGVMVDVTEKKQLEEEFLQAQKMEAVGRLAGGVAHDFNNLLTVILGYTQILSDRPQIGQQFREHLGEIRQAGERAAALTRRLLAFSRRQVMEPQVVNLNAVVGGLERMLSRLIGEDVELVSVLEPDLGSVQVDPAQMEQVIMNLAVNARDAMPGGGKLIIETANVELDETYAQSHMAVRAGPYVMLAVSDTGQGMDSHTKSHLFEPFFTTKEKGKGTGLGLATVYGIIKQSGGNIWVYSEPGHGTIFKAYLPRVQGTPSTPQLEPAHALFRQGTETVLLVEDDDSVRAFVQRILEGAGYTVLEATRPDEALAACADHQGPIHLLFTDVVMPQMNGPELAGRFRQLRPETKVLYMSGYTDAAIVHFGVLSPETPFLQKPFTPEEIAEKVRAILEIPATSP